MRMWVSEWNKDFRAEQRQRIAIARVMLKDGAIAFCLMKPPAHWI